MRRATLVTVLSLAAVPSLAAQLPLVTVPHGALRIELSGAFYPSNNDWLNGHQQPISATLDGTRNGIIDDLQSRLGSALGQPVTGLSLGALTTVAAREHGVGDIGLAYGLTRRITIFGTLPIVYVRTRVAPQLDPTGTRLGVNPSIASPTGSPQTAAFFTQFDAAITTLAANIKGGNYTSSQLPLAQQTLTQATTMRAALYSLLADPAHEAIVLPVSGDPISTQLTTNITALQSTLNDLDVGGFAAQPAFPATALTSDEFNALLNTTSGIDLTSPNNLPHYGIGDTRAGIAVQLLDDGESGSAHWRSLWAIVSATFPNGEPADPTILLSQATGDRHPTAQLSAIGEIGAGHIGLRAEVGYQRGLPANLLQRVTAPDDALAPASFMAALRSTPGDSLSLTARPFITFAPHLALTAMAQFWRRGATNTTYLTGQSPVTSTPVSVVDEGSAANAFVVGIGISYVYTGQSRDGTRGLPVEAGWSIERTVASGTGYFPVSLTTRVSLRIYRPLVKH